LPPGYGKSRISYPVLYLLHGGGDSDESWSTIGRAGFILDNLIADGRARPMIIVMPSGHTPDAAGDIASAANAMSADPGTDPFTDDLLNNIIPYIDANYRVAPGAANRAIVGLSMGGLQAANIAFVHQDRFAWLGIFSSGWFPDVRDQFERLHGADLDRANSNFELVWVAYGTPPYEIAATNAAAMLTMFDRHHVRYQAEQTPGGHTWLNWRRYLSQIVPLLFQEPSHQASASHAR
jgi:enterochelin esterase family protein